ncbi:conserved phage C-terminal domain-containing protein [Paraclostridium bifermentans]|uniref:conserved phage C-terminal domain-containing protein n=1 Tax=Paraclostridium bifermentans TaxID=1490 RepID=UPI0025AFF924|nr:conserved phage C-terminal domain-containing protein [Paraclostridium bifermentans]
MERGFKGIWIPKEIWLNESLSIQEKVFLVEIDSLDNDEDGCFASNEYFANFFKLSKNRCSEIIKSLEKKGFIKISYIYKENSKAIDKRVIKLFEKTNRGTRETEEGYSEKCEDNNTYLNNTINNTIYSLVIDKLNILANKSYKSSSKKTQQLIKARVNEGYTLEDFYKVIENKVCTWKDDPKMDQYLRPATLFGTKFESYLNEKLKNPNKGESYGKYKEYEQHLDRRYKETISSEEAERTAREIGIDL